MIFYFWKDLLRRGDDELDYGDPFLKLLRLLGLCDCSMPSFSRHTLYVSTSR